MNNEDLKKLATETLADTRSKMHPPGTHPRHWKNLEDLAQGVLTLESVNAAVRKWTASPSPPNLLSGIGPEWYEAYAIAKLKVAGILLGAEKKLNDAPQD